MNLKELVDSRYGKRFKCMHGYLEGRTELVLDCFDPTRIDGVDHYRVSIEILDKGRGVSKRESFELPGYIRVKMS